MIAAVIDKYGGPDEFKLADIRQPLPGSGEVLIRVRYAAVNPVDWKQRMGNHRLILKASFPLVLGYDVAGEIAATGQDAKDFREGERVYARCDRRFGGAYAEYAATGAHTVARIPEGMEYREAAAVPLASVTALQALRDKAGLKKGDDLLIIGAAGGVGHFALQIGKALGARVIAVSSPAHEEMMRELKPEKLVDRTKENILEMKDRFDVVFDAAAIYNYLKCRHLLRRHGTYIHTKPRPKMLIHKLVSLFSRGRSATLLMKSKGSDLESVSEMIRSGTLRPFIDSEFPLEEIAAAHRKAQEYHTNGKIVIRIP